MLKAEFRGIVGCRRYRRTRNRNGERKGFYQRVLLTLHGWLEEIEVPRLRSGGWESGLLRKYCRKSPALDRLILQGSLLGHSTRKTVRLFKRGFGGSMSPQAVSNVVTALQDEVSGFHRREVGDDYRFIYLDGLWLKITSPVKARRVLLVAHGVGHDGTRGLIDFMLASSESEACRRRGGGFCQISRLGVSGERLEAIVHDGSAGPVKALAGYIPGLGPDCVCSTSSPISAKTSPTAGTAPRFSRTLPPYIRRRRRRSSGRG